MLASEVTVRNRRRSKLVRAPNVAWPGLSISGVAMQPGPTDSGASAAPANRRRGGWRFGLTLTVLFLSAAGLAASAAGVSAQLLPRKFTAQQQQEIIAWEMARRWRVLPAGEIFPAAITYHLPGNALGSRSGLPLKAYRVGMSRQSSCRAASDPAAARVLAAARCEAMFRATYADQADSMLVTVGVAVMPGAEAARAAASKLAVGQHPQPGVRALSFRSTLARAFGDRQRQLSWADASGPYLVMSTVGYADGRPLAQVSSDPYADQEMTSFAGGVSSAVGTPLGAQPSPPRCPGAPGC